MRVRENFVEMTPIDLKILGSLPYSEMNARAAVHPEGDGYIHIIIPIFEKDAVRVLNKLKLTRTLEWSDEESMRKACAYHEEQTKTELGAK